MGVRRRRQALSRRVLGGVALALLAVVVVVGASGLLFRALDLVGGDEAVPDPIGEIDQAQPTLHLVAVPDADDDSAAVRLAVLAQDRTDGEGTALLLPTGTIVDVPGHGTFPLGDAHTLGGTPLTSVTVANLLGIRIDAAASITTAGWTALLDSMGGVEVTVRTQLVDRGGRVRFEPGVQVLDGARGAEYLTLAAQGESELDALPRVQQVLGAVLDAVAEDPTLVDRWLGMELADGGAVIDTEDPELVRVVLLELARAREADRVTTWTLPVAPLGSGPDAGYRPDPGRTGELVADRFAAARSGGQVTGGRDVQILNGNGVPRIGQQVAERLADGGYRVVLSGNADRFTYETTRIVLHDSSEAQLAVGRDVQARLGVGELELAATPGSVVDITIVVGADFPPDGG